MKKKMLACIDWDIYLPFEEGDESSVEEFIAEYALITGERVHKRIIDINSKDITSDNKFLWKGVHAYDIINMVAQHNGDIEWDEKYATGIIPRLFTHSYGKDKRKEKLVLAHSYVEAQTFLNDIAETFAEMSV